MESNQKRSNQLFVKFLTDSRDPVTTAGRYAFDKPRLKYIWKDILKKLDIKPHMSLFDIGCGYGKITANCIALAKEKSLKLSMMDIPEILKAVKEDYLRNKKVANIRFHSGFFPGDLPANFKQKFDRILIYSVLHYTDHPLSFIDSAVKLLKPEGKLLIGDIPNMNKKGRFLASVVGRRFDANYKKMPLSKMPKYKSHHDFLSQNKKNPARIVNDTLVLEIFKKYRNLGYDVFVESQPDTLPCCFTREDILICKHD